MTINSKQKGKRYELELASDFRKYGYDARRTAQYCGNTGEAADVIGLPGIHIEAKRVEKLNLYDAMNQAKRDAEASGKGALPAVFHRKNNCKTLVIMELDSFMQIYKEYEAGKKEKEKWLKEECSQKK